MNRKLHHTLSALLATASVFGVLLLAAGPISPSARPVMPVTSAGMLGVLSSTAVAIDATAPAAASERRHLRHSRALLAMPYFSFAQGLRRNRS